MKVMRSATGSSACKRDGANANSAKRHAIKTHTPGKRRRQSIVVPFMRGLRVIALASLRAGDVASGFAAWPNRSFPGAFAIAMLYQAVLRYLDASSTDARWRIH